MRAFLTRTGSYLLLLGLLLPVQPLLAESSQDPIVYIVKSGDTLSKISKRHGVRVSELVKLNSLSNPNKIKKGQVLLIPRKGINAAEPVEVVRSAPRRNPQTPKPDNLVRDNNFDTAYEEEYVSSRKPRKVVENRDYIDIRKEVPNKKEPFQLAQNDVAQFEKEVAKKKEKNPNEGFIGGSIASWFVVDLDSEVQADFGPIKGTSIDLQDALGADDSLTIPVVNVWLAPFNNPWLIFNWEYMEFGISGRRAINDSLTFEGITFTANDTVEGKADVQRVSGWLEINPFQGDWGYIGGLIGGEYINLDARLTNDFNGTVSGTLPSLIPGVGGTTITRSVSLEAVSAHKEVDAGTVALGGQARFNINENLFVTSRVRAFSYEVSDVDFSFIDLQAQINAEFFDFLRVAGGYRALFIEAENNDGRGELNMHGPFIEGGIAF